MDHVRGRPVAEPVGAGFLQPDPQAARRGGHRPARVGARRAAGIAQGGADRSASGQADRWCGQGERRGRQPGRDEVEQVVEPGRGLAEVLEIAAIAEHRVGGVDRPVRQRCRQPADRVGGERGDVRVGEVLGQRLDHRRADVGPVELRDRPADEPGQGAMRRRKVVPLERLRHAVAGVEQPAQRERGLQEPGCRREAREAREAAPPPLDDRTDPPGDGRRQPHGERAAEQIPGGSTGWPAGEAADEPSADDDRMTPGR